MGFFFSGFMSSYYCQKTGSWYVTGKEFKDAPNLLEKDYTLSKRESGQAYEKSNCPKKTKRLRNL